MCVSWFYRVCKTVGRWNTIIGICIVVNRDSCRLFSRINRLVSDVNRAPDFNSNRFIPRDESQFEYPDEYYRVVRRRLLRDSPFLSAFFYSRCISHAYVSFSHSLQVTTTIKDERGSWPVQGRAQGSVDDPVCRVAVYSFSKVHDWNAFVKAILCKIFYNWVCSLNLFVFVKVARGLCARYYFIIAIILSIARLFIAFYLKEAFIANIDTIISFLRLRSKIR